MQYINLETWSRRDHFKFFSAYDHPHFGMCANVDLTAFRSAVRERGHSLTVSIVYVLARVSNEIPPFRYRIRERKCPHVRERIRKRKCVRHNHSPTVCRTATWREHSCFPHMSVVSSTMRIRHAGDRAPLLQAWARMSTPGLD